MKIRIIYWVVCILFFAAVFRLAAQKSDYIYRQFTTKVGLPSNECHEVFQDSRGYIWVGTDNGLVRYDGYEFKRYGINEGLGESVVFEIKEDKDGTIWVGGLSAKIFVYDPLEDMFYPYRFQNIINRELISNFPNQITLFNVINQKLELPIFSKGLLQIDTKGKEKYLYSKENTSNTFAFWLGPNWEFEIPFLVLNNTGEIRIFEIVRDKEVKFNWRAKYNHSNFSSIKGYKYNDTIIIHSDNSLRIFCENLISIVNNNFNVEETRINKKGEAVLCCLDNEGVRLYHGLHLAKYSYIMQDISATGFIEDKDGGYWITSLEHGLFYISNPDITYVGLQGKNVSNLQAFDESLFATTTSGEMYQVKPVLKQLDNELGPHSRLLKTEDNEILLWGKKDFSVLYDCNTTIKQNVIGRNPIVGLTDWKNKTIALNQVGSLFQLPNIQSYNGEHHKSKIGRIIERPNKMIVHNQQLYIGGLNGLLRIHLDSLSQNYYVPDYNEIRVEDIDINGEKFTIGTKGRGLSIFDTKTNKSSFITTKDGLIDDYIERVFTDNNNHIWAVTPSGISQIDVNKEANIIEIKNYHESHGLPTPDVYDIKSYNGIILAATGNGIIQLAPSKKNKVSTPPIILNIETEQVTMGHIKDIEVGHDENNFVISYLTINYRHAARMKYRYKIDDNDWIVTFNRIANLVDLPTGACTFEVQSQNEDGVWSESTSVNITINPPWWETWWFRSLAGALILVLLYFYYKYRVKELSYKLKVEKELNELERAALQAQMNPHFIFNCLNSIQGYIMLHKKEEAMVHLATFAKLIRKYLAASSLSLISIDEEISLLSDYIKLESLRFQDKFEISIHVDEDIDVVGTKIPPMLIQPFVENAIIHGMKGKQNNQGQIEIHFNMLHHKLNILIKDNGPGISTTSNPDKRHKSLGVSITEKRLKFIQDHAGQDYSLNIQSTSAGTSISIELPM